MKDIYGKKRPFGLKNPPDVEKRRRRSEMIGAFIVGIMVAMVIAAVILTIVL